MGVQLDGKMKSVDRILRVTSMNVTLNFKILKIAAYNGTADTTSAELANALPSPGCYGNRSTWVKKRKRVCVHAHGSDFLATPIRNILNVLHVISNYVLHLAHKDSLVNVLG